MNTSMKLGDLNCIPLYLNELVESQKEANRKNLEGHMNWLSDIRATTENSSDVELLREKIDMDNLDWLLTDSFNMPVKNNILPLKEICKQRNSPLRNPLGNVENGTPKSKRKGLKRNIACKMLNSPFNATQPRNTPQKSKEHPKRMKIEETPQSPIPTNKQTQSVETGSKEEQMIKEVHDITPESSSVLFSEEKPVKESSLKSLKTPPPTFKKAENLVFEKSPEYQYPISAYNSDEEYSSEYESEEEESEEEKRKSTTKSNEVEWTRKENLYPALIAQANFDPDNIFGSAFPKTCDLEKIFGKRKFRPRSSSVNWSSDRLLKSEEIEYKKAMGYN